jgi:hypothetical protein
VAQDAKDIDAARGWSFLQEIAEDQALRFHLVQVGQIAVVVERLHAQLGFFQ